MEGKIDEEEVKEEKPVETPEVEEVVAEETPEVPEPEPEPEDNTMTLAEYMALKQKKDDKAAGREVVNEFQGKTAAAKVEEDFLVLGGGKSKKKKKEKEAKPTVDVAFRVVCICLSNQRVILFVSPMYFIENVVLTLSPSIVGS